jgi:hypothetical protein
MTVQKFEEKEVLNNLNLYFSFLLGEHPKLLKQDEITEILNQAKTL